MDKVALLETRKLTKLFQGKTIIDNLDLNIKKGEEKLAAAHRTYNSNVIAFKPHAVYEVPQSKKEDVSMKQVLNG